MRILTQTYYEDLIEQIASLRQAYKIHNDCKRATQDAYIRVKQELSSVAIKYDYPRVEQELASLISADNNPLNPLLVGGDALNYLCQLQIIDKEVDNMQALYTRYRNGPDLHGAHNLANKLKVFLDKLPQIPLQRLEMTAKQTLPSILAAFTQLDNAFGATQQDLAQLQQEAKSFKSLLDQHAQSVDRYNMHKARTKSVLCVQNILQQPDVMQLSQMTNELEQCQMYFHEVIEAFEKDKDYLSEQLKQSDNWNIWLDILDSFKDTCLDHIRNIYDVASSPSDFMDELRREEQRKKYEIEQDLKRYQNKTKDHFSKDIQNLKNMCFSKSALINLCAMMDAYEEEQRKVFYIKVAKYSGIVATTLIVLYLYYVSQIVFWIVLVLVAGFVFYILGSDD